MVKEWRLVEQTSNGFVHELYIDGKPVGLYKNEFPAIPIIYNTDFEGLTADGIIAGSNVVYAIARSTSTQQNTTEIDMELGQLLSAGVYWVYRAFVKFNTSAIPDADIITQVNLKLTCITDESGTDFDVQIVKQDWSAQDPISDANREAAYDNCLAGAADDSIWRNTNGMAINTPYTSGNLSTAWVDKTGNTYYSLRSSRDYDDTTPTDLERILLATTNHGTAAYRPTLIVLHFSSQVAKIGGVDFADIATIHGVARAQVSKIKGVSIL